MDWICIDDKMPPEGEYVFIRVNDFIGISRLKQGEWDCGMARKLPLFKKYERSRSAANPQYWSPLDDL
jgi:hypothetical protein